MSRLLTLILALTTMIFTGASAQCTINTGNATNGFTPASLPSITQGVTYGQAAQIHIPATQTAGAYTVNVDSVRLLSLTGLPAGITVTGSPADSIIHGGANGCLWYSGTTNAAVGAYPLTFTIRIWTDYAGTSIGPRDTTLAAIGYPDTLKVVAGATITCDTIFNVSSLDTPSQYIFTRGGYLGGNNGWGDEGKAEGFTGPIGSQVSGALLLFSNVTILAADSAKTVKINVMDATGTAGAPGAVLDTGTITLRQIAADVTAGRFSAVSFSNGPVLASHNFYIAIVLPTTTGDTVAVYVDNQNNSYDGDGWELESDGNWYSYYNVYLNGFGPHKFGNFIAAITCGGRAVANFEAINDMGCGSATVQFVSRSSNGVTGLSWSFPNGVPDSSTAASVTVTYSTPGSYNVTLRVTGANGGDTTVQTGVVQVFPALSASVTTTPASSASAADGSATATASAGTTPYYYNWSPNPAADTFPSLSNVVHGTYIVTVSDANGCYVVDTATISYTSGITAVANDKWVKIYPNPATNLLNLVWNSNTEAEVVLVDVAGNEIRKYSTRGLTNVLDIHDIAAGTYMVRITEKQSGQQQSLRFNKF